MNHVTANRDRREMSLMSDEQCELERCKQEIARLKQLVVQLSEIVLRNVVNSAEARSPAP
jgi:hypothetical protein